MDISLLLFIASKIECINEKDLKDQLVMLKRFEQKLQKEDILPDSRKKGWDRHSYLIPIYLRYGFPVYLCLDIINTILLALLNFILPVNWFFWCIKSLIRIFAIIFLGLVWIINTYYDEFENYSHERDQKSFSDEYEYLLKND